MALDTSTIKLTDLGGVNQATITAANALKIDGSAVVQPVSGTVTANAGTGTLNVAGTGTAGTPTAAVLSVQGVSGGTAVPTTAAVPVALFSEAATARTVSGNSANITPTANPQGLILSWNVTAVSGTSPALTLSLQQQDANGVFQTLGTSVSITAVAAGNFSCGSGLVNQVLISGNNVCRIAWTISGTTPSFTFQSSLVGR